MLFRTEGRILAQLVGLAMDQKSAALFCHRTVTSLLLVQNLARWAGTPPSVLAHLLKQAVVRNQPQVRMLILKPPQPALARPGRAGLSRPAAAVSSVSTSNTRSLGLRVGPDLEAGPADLPAVLGLDCATRQSPGDQFCL